MLLIQQAARICIAQRHKASGPDILKAAIIIQKCVRGWMVRSQSILGHAPIDNASLMCQKKGLSNSEIDAATRIQTAWKNFVSRSRYKQTYAATKIQSHYRGWQLRRSFMKQKQAITKIQSNFRRMKCWRAFQIAWKEFVCKSLQNQTFAATKIQSHFRGWQLRRGFMKQKQAIIKVQSNFRRLKCSRAFRQYKTATRSAIIIQSYVRRWISQKQAWRHRYLIVLIQVSCFFQKNYIVVLPYIFL